MHGTPDTPGDPDSDSPAAGRRRGGGLRAFRRLLQVAALVGTLLVGVLALALIVSQTPWFKDWLRRYVVRESRQYLNGDLTIGGMGGNLLFGIDLTDVAVDVSGERIVAVKAIELEYSVFELVSKGIVLNQIKLDRPVLRVARDGQGWNLGRLIKSPAKEADREGPGRSISLPSIEIYDAVVAIDDRSPSDAVTLPRRIDDLDIKAAFEYEPVHYTLTLHQINLAGTAPALSLRQLTGVVALRDDNLYVQQMAIKTTDSSVTIDGVVEKYLRTPLLNVTTSGNVSLPEIGRFLPAVAGYDLHPAVDIKAKGTLRALALNLDVRSEAGSVRGQVDADAQAPDLSVRGEVDVERLNLAPLLKDASQKSDITGHATLDLTMTSAPATAPVADRLAGTFAFNGPRVSAAGYDARNVKATGSLDGPRITLDGRAAAYGGTATARGFIVTPAPGRALAFDLTGQARGVDLRRLPASTGAPALATNLSLSTYHVVGSKGAVSGTATLNASEVEGAAIGDGTTASFDLTPAAIAYTASGSVAELDLHRLGGALKVAALDTPAYDSRINGTFDVTGTLPRTPPGRRRTAEPATALMTLDASGRLSDSTVLGGRVPAMAFEAHLDRGALSGRADGRFEDFNPGQLTGRKAVEGSVTGTVDARFALANINAPLTPDAVTADGVVRLESSTVGGLRLDTAALEGRYAAQVGEITALNVAGPDVKLTASGRLALDRTTQSNVTYHVEAINVTELARLAGQTGVGGTAVLDGSLTGNGATLRTDGTLDGSNLSYEANSALDLNSRYAVSVPDLDFAKAHVEATSEATFVKAGGMEINGITATTTYEQNRLDFVTNVKEKTRELDARGQLVLHPDHQEIHLPELAVRTEGVEWRTAPGSEATINYGGSRVEMKGVRLVSGDQTLDVTGAIAMGAKPSADRIEVHARNVDLQQLQRLALMDRGLAGRVNADAIVSGSTAAPKIDGTLSVVNGAFQTYRFDSLTVKGDYGGTRIGLDAVLQQSPTENITVKGSVPTTLFQAAKGEGHVAPAAGDEVDLQITSNALGLAVLQGVTTQITNVTGTLQADVHVGGSGRDPHLRGYIDIKGGGFAVPATGGAFSGLTTRVDLEPDVIRLREFQLLDHHNEKLTVAGELAVHERQLGGVNITVNSDNFELMDNELGDIQVQAALRITGEVRKPRVEGDVRLDAARIEVDRVLQLFYNPYAVEAMPEVVSAERQAEGSGSAEEATKTALTSAHQSGAATPVEAKPADADAAPAPASAFDPVALDVRVVVPDNLVLRGKDIRPGGPTGTAFGNLNITVGGDVRVRKDPGGKVAPLGVVNTIRGTYEFQGRRFDLVRGGTLRFIGTPTINPLLDVSATRKIGTTGVEARVHVTGTLQAPQLALTSTPPLEESDILALIVFNRPVNELGTGERSSLAATAGGIATGFIAAPLGDSIGRALDLDLFEITTTTESGDLGAGITLGQQLGERAFVRLRQQFGARNTTEVQLEYQLARFLRAQASASPETSGSANRINQRRVERAGIDLIFFFSY